MPRLHAFQHHSVEWMESNLYAHSPSEKHLGCFQVLPVMDKSALHVQKPLYVCRYKHLTHLDPWIPRNSRTGSYDKIMKKSEDYFQRTINTLCSSGGKLKHSVFEGSDEKESGLKAIQHSLPKGAEEDDHSSSAVGPAVPSSPGTGGATQAPHCTSRGMGWVAIDLCQRYDLQQHVPFWMVDYLFPFSFYQFSSVQLHSHVRPFRTPWTSVGQASLSITNSQSLLKLMSIESVIPSSHLILCCSPSPPAFNLSRSFPVSQFFTSGGQSIGISASASVLPVNI